MTQPSLFAPEQRRTVVADVRPAVHPGRAGQAAAPARADRASRPRSSPRRSSRCWWSPAPARARPRRWPRGWSGWSPTATSARTQVLGLTFTRKAAGELAHRVRTRLGQLAPPAAGRDDAARRRADRRDLPLVRRPDGHRARPAGRVRADHPAAHRGGLLAARRRGRAQLRRRHDRRGRARRARSPTRCSRSPASWPSTWSPPTSWPPGPAGSSPRCRRRPGRVYADVHEGARAASRPGSPCCRWCAAYDRRKTRLEAMDFGDQMARAARVARDHPEVGAIERDRFRVVLLDEYQDTSHAQVVLLRVAVRRRASGDRGRRPVPVHLRLARGAAPARSTGSRASSRAPTASRPAR